MLLGCNFLLQLFLSDAKKEAWNSGGNRPELWNGLCRPSAKGFSFIIFLDPDLLVLCDLLIFFVNMNITERLCKLLWIRASSELGKRKWKQWLYVLQWLSVIVLWFVHIINMYCIWFLAHLFYTAYTRTYMWPTPTKPRLWRSPMISVPFVCIQILPLLWWKMIIRNGPSSRDILMTKYD